MNDEKKNNKDKISKLIIYILGVIALIMGITSASNESHQGQTMEFTGLEYNTHMLIFGFLWPSLVTIVCIVLFPLIFIPAIMFLKNKVWSKYKNGYVDTGSLELDPNLFFKRAIFLFLLIMGLNAALVSMGIIDPALLTSDALVEQSYIGRPESIAAYKENPLYYSRTFGGLSLLILPFAVGLLSISWTMKDIGLMHYKIPNNKKDKLFEIEPTYIKFNSMIKGYAGISSIIFFVTALSFYVSINDTERIIFVLLETFIMMFFMVPAYLIYIKLNPMFTKIFRRNYRDLSESTEKILKEFE